MPRTAGSRLSSEPRADPGAGAVKRRARAPRPSALATALLPNRAVDGAVAAALVVLWALAAFGVWAASPWESLPGPREVLNAFSRLWWVHGLGPELWTTVKLILHALLVTVVLSMALSTSRPALPSWSRPLARATMRWT